MNKFSMKLFAALTLAVCAAPIHAIPQKPYETRMEDCACKDCSCKDCSCKDAKECKECLLKHDIIKKSIIKRALKASSYCALAVAYLAYFEPYLNESFNQSKFQNAAKKIAEVLLLKELLNAVSEEIGKPLFNKVRPFIDLPYDVLVG